jgi:hypothetical protein
MLTGKKCSIGFTKFFCKKEFNSGFCYFQELYTRKARILR